MGYLSCKAESAVAVSTPSKSSSSSLSNQQTKPIKIEQFRYSDLEAATNNFSSQKLLGKGSHGCVYKAVLRGGRHVAVKKPSRGLEIGQELDNEIEILSNIHSPRLVNLVGYAHHNNNNNNDSKDRLLVVEFMSKGTLYDILHNNSRTLPNWGRRIRLAMQVATAVETLHSQNPPIIHRDIKSANVLIDSNCNARLGDFGLALRCGADDDYRLRSTPPAGTMGYLDPGYVTPDNLSTKTDVFSFGILLLEIVSGRKAIDVGHSPPSIVDWAIPMIKKGKLGGIFDPRIPPLKDPVVRKHLALVAAKCVRSCRERRPAMKEVVDWLTTLSKLVPLHLWNGFSNPCLMVETMGHPVELRSNRVGLRAKSVGGDDLDVADAQLGRHSLKESRRVHSDLGFRCHSMDLMAGTESKLGLVVESNLPSPMSRFARTRYNATGASQSEFHGSHDRSLPRLRRSHLSGDGSGLFSKRDVSVAHPSLRAQC